MVTWGGVVSMNDWGKQGSFWTFNPGLHINWLDVHKNM